jgi:hypothetical protein
MLRAPCFARSSIRLGAWARCPGHRTTLAVQIHRVSTPKIFLFKLLHPWRRGLSTTGPLGGHAAEPRPRRLTFLYQFEYPCRDVTFTATWPANCGLLLRKWLGT